MMRAMTPAPRPSPQAGLALALAALVAAGCAATPIPTPTPTASPVLSASAVPGTPADLFAGALPLPPDLLLPQGDFSVSAESEPGMPIGTPIAYDLGHCGLYSPVDLDGSLWDPVAGVDREGGPIDTDAEVGALINGTKGEAILVARERLDWRAGREGVVVVFGRIDGTRDYPGCQ